MQVHTRLISFISTGKTVCYASKCRQTKYQSHGLSQACRGAHARCLPAQMISAHNHYVDACAVHRAATTAVTQLPCISAARQTARLQAFQSHHAIHGTRQPHSHTVVPLQPLQTMCCAAQGLQPSPPLETQGVHVWSPWTHARANARASQTWHAYPAGPAAGHKPLLKL